MSKQSYCAEYLQQHDLAQYTLCLLAPPDKREALFVTFSILQEIDAIYEKAGDPSAAQLRLKWWYDKLTTAYQGEVLQGHPILSVFPNCCPQDGFPFFEIYINAAQDILCSEQKPDLLLHAMTHMEEARVALAGIVLSVDDIPTETEPMAVARLLLNVPQSLSSGREPVLSHDLWADATQVTEYVDKALQRIEELRGDDNHQSHPKAGASIFLSYAMAEYRLKHIRKMGYDLQNARLLGLPPFTAVRLLWRSFLQRY